MTASQWIEMSISSWSEIFFKHLSKYFIYLTNNDLENVKSRFSFLLSSITWIIIESLKLALSMLESKFEVYWAAVLAVDVDAAFMGAAILLLLVPIYRLPPLFELI